MKHFKKRTLALVLASVITVVGAFGAENYKNSLMSLKFENSASGAVNVTVLTKRDYEQTITPIKTNATTYVIMLPETNSKMPSSPELAGDVESVNVRTMPYTTNSKGYTKITIKTAPNTALNTQKALYIPDNNKTLQQEPPQAQTPPPQSPRPNYNYPEQINIPQPNTYQPNNRYDSIHSRSGVDQTNPVDIKTSVKQFESNQNSNPERSNTTSTTVEEQNTTTQQVEPTPTTTLPDYNSSNSSEVTLLILGTILVIITCVYLFIRSKNKMAEILGEQGDFDISDEPKKKKENKKKQEQKKKIKTTIKNLDRMYTKPVKMPLESITTTPTQSLAPIEERAEEKEENLIVDLDELFQEKTKQESSQKEEVEEVIEEEEENSALEDFLSAFSFVDEENEVEEPLFNEELFNKFINDDNLKFSQSDIEKINKLLNSEISDDTMRNINEFVVTNPIVEKKPSHREVLENFVTAYTINQNITFTKSDVDALYKLISVEIDPDFINDLHTNPERLKEMQKEMAERKSKPHKSSEILTLNVKNMLPDLSEALKKQGGRRIESEVKPQVVYYSEGYDVSTISLKDQLPDLSVEINNADAYKSRPSAEIQLVESGYDFEKMSVSNDLPDLNDVLLHPEKYESTQTQPVEVDEESLLRNITNVTFKPFYDGSETFEVINEFDEANTPSVYDMQEEFNQFDDSFEIINNDEEEIQAESENDINDFESLYDNTYVDFDRGFKEKNLFDEPEKIEENHTEENHPVEEKDVSEDRIEIIPPTEHKPFIKPPRGENEDKLLQFIEEKRKERQAKKEFVQTEIKKQEKLEQQENLDDDIIPSEPSMTCIIDNEEYEIVSTINFSRRSGCYLVKNQGGYEIAGFVGSDVFKIKHYDELKSEKIQARISEKLDNEKTRYILKVSNHKLIVNVSITSIEYVMELC